MLELEILIGGYKAGSIRGMLDALLTKTKIVKEIWKRPLKSESNLVCAKLCSASFHFIPLCETLLSFRSAGYS